MKTYLELLQKILDHGERRADRTGTGTLSLFGHQMRFDLGEGFPLVTTKKVFLRGIIFELLWFLRGETNIAYLVRNDVKIWNEWAFQVYLEKMGFEKRFPRYSETWQVKLQEFVEMIKSDDAFASKWGELGPIYGKQWRRWAGPNGIEVDQIGSVIDQIKNNPRSRRLLVSGWNVGEIRELIQDPNHAPPPCHTLFQFYVHEDRRLDCQLYQRSADVFLGVPFNIASYALLTLMMAHVTGCKPGTFIHTFGDAHLYLNHLDQAKLQLTRAPKKLPQVILNPNAASIFDFCFEDFTLEGYDPHPAIKAEISV